MIGSAQSQHEIPATTTRRSIPRRIARLPLRAVGFPYRLYRRRISVQLIVSHVLVVLLTILVLEAALIGVLLAFIRWGGDQHFLDYSVTKSAESSAALIASEHVPGTLDTLSDEECNRLRDGLGLLTAGSQGNEPSFRIGISSADEEPNFSRLDQALIANREGRVIVSTSTAWVPEGQPISVATSDAVTSVTERVIELDGQPSEHDNLWVIDGEEHATIVSHPIVRDGEMVGAVTVQSEPTVIPSPGEILWGVLGANAVFLAVMTIPSLIVSVPVGIWRGRTLSKRLSALADTASAMADGDLCRRVTVRGRDEVAQVSQRFNDMVKRLDETDRTRKSFVANVSPELRTPVAIIQGNAERLLDGTSRHDGVGGQTQALEVIHQETVTLSRLIDDLFTLARIEEAQLPLVSIPVDVRELAGQVVEGIAPVAWEQRKVSVQAVVPESLPRVTADPTRLRQILGNLIYNALRHTPEGGLVVVSAERIERRVQILVADTGIGMTEEQLARVFDRFYQVERAGRNAEGSGLGLTIVKHLVDAQGGTIDVESQPGHGTVFRFTLPVEGLKAQG